MSFKSFSTNQKAPAKDAAAVKAQAAADAAKVAKEAPKAK